MKHSKYLTLIVLLTGCSSMNDHPIQEMTPSNAPFVEAQLEYSGPDARWGGPATINFYMSAAGDTVKAVMRPELIDLNKKQELAPGSRHLAALNGYKVEDARKDLLELAQHVLESESPYKGCMYPVKVKIVRSDGAVLEKKGCRSESGWTRSASQWMSKVMNAYTSG